MKTSIFNVSSRARRDTVLMFLSEFTLRASGLVSNLILSRTLKAGQVGVFYFSMSFARLLEIILSFSAMKVMMRRVAKSEGNPATHFNDLLGFRAATAPAYLLITFLLAFYTKGDIWRIILAAAFIVFLETTHRSFEGYFLALRKIPYVVLSVVPAQLAALFLLAVALLCIPAVETLIAMTIFRGCLFVMGAIYFAHRKVSPLGISWSNSLVRESLTFIAIGILNRGTAHIDTMFVGYLVGYDTVGAYNLASNLIVASFLIPYVAQSLIFPRLAANGTSPANRSIYLRTAIGLVALGSAVTATLGVASPLLCNVIYGPLGPKVAPLLRIFAIIIPFEYLASFNASAIAALHQEHRLLSSLIVTGIVVLLASAILVPLYGAYGAIAAQIISALCQSLLLLWFILQAFRGRTSSGCP